MELQTAGRQGLISAMIQQNVQLLFHKKDSLSHLQTLLKSRLVEPTTERLKNEQSVKKLKRSLTLIVFSYK